MCACVRIHISRGIHVCAFAKPLGEEKTKEISLVSESVFSVYAIIYFQNRKTTSTERIISEFPARSAYLSGKYGLEWDQLQG